MPNTIDTSLAELATHSPAASRVFRRYGLDFCCAGRRTLAVACGDKDLDAVAVLREVEDESTHASPDAVDWRTRPLTELIAHIVHHYHEPLRPELDRLIEMAAKVERVHADKEGCPHGLADLLRAARHELDSHMRKEESILFPLIASGAGRSAMGPISVLTHEHDEHGDQLRRIRALTGELVAPSRACVTWKALYLGLDALERDLMEHVHLENYILFPRALQG